jgi:transitional endoplasmic reticulum ATPase
MDKLTNQGVFWIASCTTDTSNKSSLPVQSRAFGPSRFSHVINTETLSQNDRFLILQALLSKFPQPDLCEISEFLSLRTNGYSPADLSLLASTLMSSLQSIHDFKNLVEMKKECHKVLSIVRPSLLNDAIGSLSRDVSLSQVFGMEDAIKSASQAVLLPLQHAHLFQQIGSIAPSGLLLHGPSGCGKTYLAHAIANHASATLKLCNALVVQGPDIISARLGSS